MITDNLEDANRRYICVSAFKEFENKSLEELRWEDYILNKKYPEEYACLNSIQEETEKTISNFIEYPEYWIKSKFSNNYLFYEVLANSNEFVQIESYFKSRFFNLVSVKMIHRIQNEDLYIQFFFHKQKLIKENKKLNETHLFHGSTEDALLKICKHGFNRSYSGTKIGCIYGRGVYFALNSSMSDKYVFGKGIKKMLIAKVLVGESCVGNQTMLVPPEKPNGRGFYDTTTDHKREIFCCFHDNQCYPLYLITYSC